ncbi:MAG TPA: hypothetical protein PLE28_02510 [bacterium]|nr:hypothetical protein [bacterium]
MLNFFKETFTNKGVEKNKSKTETQIEKNNKTPDKLRLYGDKVIDLFCKEFKVEGKEKIEELHKQNPDQKFIISAAHLNNLDVPAALKVWGNDFNIHLTGESVLLEKMKYLGQRLMINLAGKDNFTPLEYKESENGKHGSFNSDNFNELGEIIEKGKTPWIAAHPFALDGKMKRPSIGPVYLAAKTGAMLIPTALDVRGGSVNLEGALERTKTLMDRSLATYHIGTPFSVPAIDVSIVEKVLQSRKNGEEVNSEDFEKFKSVINSLHQQADEFGKQIETLLPEDKRRE